VDVQDEMATDNIERMLKTASMTWRNTVLITCTGEAGWGRYMREKMGSWRPAGTRRAISTGVPGAKVMYEIMAAAPRSG
jgi:hypothetical protein